MVMRSLSDNNNNSINNLYNTHNYKNKLSTTRKILGNMLEYLRKSRKNFMPQSELNKKKHKEFVRKDNKTIIKRVENS